MKQALHDIAYHHMLDLILSGQLKYGDKICEQDIVDRLGISRTPVREAIRRLASDGILDFYPSRYANVHTFSPQEQLDHGILRIATDSIAAQLAIFNGSNRDFQAMLVIANHCEEAALRQDFNGQLKYDAEFHNKLVELSGNAELIHIQHRLSLRSCLLHIQSYLINHTNFCEPVGHFDIVNALMERDVDACLLAIRTHLQKFYVNLSNDATAVNIANVNIELPFYSI